ncbi:MAG: Eco57I restriction-modification methylase domain-containing protein [Bacteroides caccae]
MNKRTFQQLLLDGDFRELFITELGWNKWKVRAELLPITIDGTDFQFRTVADRNGLQVVVTEVSELPKASLARRIDAQLRKQAQDYIAIYILCNNPGHHQWVIPVKNVDKRDLVSIEYESPEKTDFLFSKMQDLEFEPTERTTIVDVKAAVHSAFSVNSEKITKDFYAGFRKEHKAFAKFISGIDDELSEKDNRNKQWYASVMLNRLMFCYFIQKKGFLNSNVNYLRDKLDWCRKERGEDRFFSTFYRGFLTRLFSDGLNKPNHDREFQQQFGRIPFLNGGMFDSHKIEREYTDIDIADEAFISLFTFFDKWQWHLDTRVTASGKDINPDVLGYIFEQYINDRAQMGAYYTKEDITEYIGRNTILPFLFGRVGKASKPMAELFAPDGWIWQQLKQSGDRYIFDAVKQGYTTDWRERIPENIAIGLDTTKPELLERRKDWNTKTPEPFALPTEIWRETIERLQRCEDILDKISKGDIVSINDFITYNLDIRQFTADLINTDDAPQSFIYNFYDALRSVTILDPTCGSGAFLFAAMNILEPLYYDCITRLEGIERKSPDTQKALDEIKSKYRSNIHYFIYKSIILRNLYGVDIMAEATEIAKLRLFLKMVAVVDVQPLADNLGLDPLPDIDFNIRCGNTLVGYANAESIVKDHSEDIFAIHDFEENIATEMDKVARTFKLFKHLQLTQESEHHEEFIAAKHQLRDLLSSLNDTLNHHLHNATASGMPYEEWLNSHQPFNWVAEFYDIIHGNGGFDVIIGNPPYVEYNRKNKESKKAISDIYKLVGYKTIKCGNLYAYVIERSSQISNSTDNIGFIVPLTLASNNNMLELRNLIVGNGLSWFSHYEVRPAKLFEGAEQRLTIFIMRKSSKTSIFSTSIIRWHNEHRTHLFVSIHYAASFFNGTIWRTSAPIETSIYHKFLMQNSSSLLTREKGFSLQYRTAGVRYWIIFVNNGFGTESLSNKTVYYEELEQSKFFMAAFNSNIYWWYYALNFDMFNHKDYMIFGFRLSYRYDENLIKLANLLEKDLENNKVKQIINSKTRGIVSTSYYQKKQSKPIIDEIDKVLANHYGFTDEELDFIINYDIKYRMGDELNNEE